MLGGYSGRQAEYLRVPMADVGPIKVPDTVTDEQALFLSDIFPTGYMAAENARIEDGDTGYPTDTVENMRINVFADGLFHAATYGFVVAGILVLWRKARRPHFLWSGGMLAGSVLTGFGAFNVIEGAVNHHLLEIHHVNETVPRDQWIWWDVGFVLWGAFMLFVGVLLLRNSAE